MTGANAEAPEEPCTVTDEETQETFEVPFGYTAWWTFNGTGGQVTIDTAGSTFDTVLAVYTGSPGSFTQVACVDDVSIRSASRRRPPSRPPAARPTGSRRAGSAATRVACRSRCAQGS